MSEPPCEHLQFRVDASVNFLQDNNRYMLDLRVTCEKCGKPFRFLGLSAGVDLDGAAVSVDGLEGHFAIAPKGEVVTEIEGTPRGFTIRKER